jgi:5-methylcytosine-specific restriction protein A
MVKPMDSKRSGHWPTLRKHFLQGKVCAVCGGSRKLEAHHIMPFHLDPTKELDPLNLIALCEGNPKVNCHLVYGHLGNFKGLNSAVVSDSHVWRNKFDQNQREIKARK